jgi:hypothetical protein
VGFIFFCSTSSSFSFVQHHRCHHHFIFFCSTHTQKKLTNLYSFFLFNTHKKKLTNLYSFPSILLLFLFSFSSPRKKMDPFMKPVLEVFLYDAGKKIYDKRQNILNNRREDQELRRRDQALDEKRGASKSIREDQRKREQQVFEEAQKVYEVGLQRLKLADEQEEKRYNEEKTKLFKQIQHCGDVYSTEQASVDRMCEIVETAHHESVSSLGPVVFLQKLLALRTEFDSDSTGANPVAMLAATAAECSPLSPVSMTSPTVVSPPVVSTFETSTPLLLSDASSPQVVPSAPETSPVSVAQDIPKTPIAEVSTPVQVVHSTPETSPVFVAQEDIPKTPIAQGLTPVAAAKATALSWATEMLEMTTATSTTNPNPQSPISFPPVIDVPSTPEISPVHVAQEDILKIPIAEVSTPVQVVPSTPEISPASVARYIPKPWSSLNLAERFKDWLNVCCNNPPLAEKIIAKVEAENLGDEFYTRFDHFINRVREKACGKVVYFEDLEDCGPEFYKELGDLLLRSGATCGTCATSTTTPVAAAKETTLSLTKRILESTTSTATSTCAPVQSIQSLDNFPLFDKEDIAVALTWYKVILAWNDFLQPSAKVDETVSNKILTVRSAVEGVWRLWQSRTPKPDPVQVARFSPSKWRIKVFANANFIRSKKCTKTWYLLVSPNDAYFWNPRPHTTDLTQEILRFFCDPVGYAKASRDKLTALYVKKLAVKSHGIGERTTSKTTRKVVGKLSDESSYSDLDEKIANEESKTVDPEEAETTEDEEETILSSKKKKQKRYVKVVEKKDPRFLDMFS